MSAGCAPETRRGHAGRPVRSWGPDAESAAHRYDAGRVPLGDAAGPHSGGGKAARCVEHMAGRSVNLPAIIVETFSAAWQPFALPCRSLERDRLGRRQRWRSGSRDRRRRRSRDKEDKFKGSLSEGMKAEQEESDDEV